MPKEIVDFAASRRGTSIQDSLPIDLTAEAWTPVADTLWDALEETTLEFITQPQSTPNRTKDIPAEAWTPVADTLWDALEQDAEQGWGTSSTGVIGQRMVRELESVAKVSDQK